MFFNVRYNRYHIYYIICHISSISKVYRGPGAKGDYFFMGKKGESHHQRSDIN